MYVMNLLYNIPVELMCNNTLFGRYPTVISLIRQRQSNDIRSYQQTAVILRENAVITPDYL